MADLDEITTKDWEYGDWWGVHVDISGDVAVFGSDRTPATHRSASIAGRSKKQPFRARELQPCCHTQVAEACGAEVSKTNRSNTHIGFAY